MIKTAYYSNIYLKFLLLIAGFMLITACANTAVKEKTLYERIGGKEVLSKVSASTLDAMTANVKTKRSFDGVKMKTLKESLTNFLCIKTGGDCVYDGETMKKSHADAKITTAEFELMVQALRDSLDAEHVGTREKNELLKILAPMKQDVVTN